MSPSIPPLEVDRDQIKQVFYNIIRNAFQATKTEASCACVPVRTETHVFIAFSDTGGGISPENISQVFEPYFSTKQGGSGLGLLIVRRIVKSHGGEVVIESAPGRGVTFTIRLPRSDRRVRFLEQGESGA